MKRLLIIDDDKTSRDVVKLYIQKYYLIDEAVKPDEALELISKNKYDAILMDIGLGFEMNGITLANKIHEIKGYEKIPIIAVTAFATVFDRENIISGGLDYYISKPFLREDLLGLLAKVFKQYGRQDKNKE